MRAATRRPTVRDGKVGEEWERAPRPGDKKLVFCFPRPQTRVTLARLAPRGLALQVSSDSEGRTSRVEPQGRTSRVRIAPRVGDYAHANPPQACSAAAKP